MHTRALPIVASWLLHPHISPFCTISTIFHFSTKPEIPYKRHKIFRQTFTIQQFSANILFIRAYRSAEVLGNILSNCRISGANILCSVYAKLPKSICTRPGPFVALAVRKYLGVICIYRISQQFYDILCVHAPINGKINSPERRKVADCVNLCGFCWLPLYPCTG